MHRHIRFVFICWMQEEILDVRLARERANLGSRRKAKPSAKSRRDSVDGPKVMEIPIDGQLLYHDYSVLFLLASIQNAFRILVML